MKRWFQSLLACFLLFSFAAEARVILPKGGEEWSVGSSVLLQWDASDSPVEIHLIRPDQDPIVIAEGLANTDHYLWPIEELEAARDYRIEIKPSGGNAAQSRTFRIIAWDERQYLGAFEETDRSKVTHPLKAAVLDKDKDNRAVTVDWVDYRHFLKDNVRIFLYQVGNVRQLALKTKLDNTGRYDWELNNRSINTCTGGLCYFVIRSGRKRGQFITSHPFTLGDNADARAYTVSSAAQQGSDLAISWQDNTDAPSEVRIDIVKEDAFYESVGESQSSPGDANTLSWPIPSTVRAGEYTLLLTKLADGTQRASSEPFVIETPEDAVKVAIKRKISTTTQTTLAIWANNRETVDIDLYRDGKWVKAIARDGSVASLRNWKLPRIFTEGDGYTVRVTQADNPEIFGFSDPFSISAPGATVAKVPSDKRCQKAGLDTGCTAEALKVALRQKQRDCVTYRLYGEECTVENIARARDENEERRALDSTVVTVGNCPEGEIAIGNQCRPESQCPGLALLDEPRPDNVLPHKGIRRCDQNLIQGLSMTDAYMAALLEFLLAEMLGHQDADFNPLVAVELFKLYNHSSRVSEPPLQGPCESAQAKAFYSDPICMDVLEASGLKAARFTCNRGNRPVCPAWGNLDESKAKRDSASGRSLFLNETLYGESRLVFLGRDQENSKFGFIEVTGDQPTAFHVDFWDHLRDEFNLLNENRDEQATPLKKGFYWPSEPVVHPDAFDALSPAARVHAQFIWRTAKIREALYDTSRLTNEDGEFVSPPIRLGESLKNIERASERPWHSGNKPEATLLVADGGKDGTEDLQLIARNHSPAYEPWRWRKNSSNAFPQLQKTMEEINSSFIVPESASDLYPACPAGMEARDGQCQSCMPGAFKPSETGLCRPCSRNLAAVEGAYGCELCPMGQVPSENHSACIDNPCTGNEYWDSGTDRCVKGARARHKWSQMMYFDLTEDLELLNHYYSDLQAFENALGKATRRLAVTIRADDSNLRKGSFDPRSFGGIKFTSIDNVDETDDGIQWESVDKESLRGAADHPHRMFSLMLRGAMERQLADEVTEGNQEKGVMALHISGHGSGFGMAAMDMATIRKTVREEIGDGRLDLLTADACLMGNLESLLMLDGVVRWVVASPEVIDFSGFNFSAFADSSTLVESEATEARVKYLVKHANPKDKDNRLYVLAGHDMIHFPAFRDAFNAVLDYLANEDNMRNHETRLAKLIYENPEAKVLRPTCVDYSGSVALDNCAAYYHATTHLKFGTRRFLEAFIDPAVGQPLAGLATTALAELDRFMEKGHSGGERFGGRSATGHDLLPFAWFIDDPLEVRKTRPLSASSVVEGRVRAIPNWAPLDSLRRFNAMWAEIRGH